MLRSIKNESGAVAIVVALVMVVLIGFSAIVIDYGNIAVHKRALQNAVDAACLAAAQELPNNTSAAEDAAVKYLTANAPSAILKSVVFTNSNKKITVTATIDVEYEMARAFVSDASTTVTAAASAVKTNVFGPFDYALFSGSDIDLLQFTGQNYVFGDVHSNNSVKNSATVDGTVTAAGIIDGKINATDKVPGYNVLAMPDFSKVMDLTAEVSQSTLLSYGATFKNGTYTMSPDQYNAIIAAFSGKTIYINGNVTIDGSGVCATGCLIVSGDITFNGSGVNMGAGDKMCMASLNGDINFDGGGGEFNGILYAPIGEINFNGQINSINGSVIGNVIRGNGGLYIHYDPDAKNSVPDTKIMLVE
ncbi:hypothetical protein IZU99_01315 [Oscillospiraceae bacterium CM]|nr:hypothetical protein IZU99_01315 [Oscillospiraceae bacterium CM]